jgi:hypothetical protein
MQEIYFKKVQEIYKEIEPYCTAIYLGGSRVDPVIENPKDYDFIVYVKPNCRHLVYIKLNKLGLTNSVLASRKGYPGLDISQLISPPHNQLN